MRFPALLHVAAHAEIAVADCEEGFGDAEIAGCVASLGERPVLDREPLPVERVGDLDRIVPARASHQLTNSSRSATTRPAPASRQPIGTGATIDPDHQPEPAGLPRLDTRQRVLDDDGSGGGDAELPGGVQKVSGAGLPDSDFGPRPPPVDHHVEPVGQTGGREHRRALREDETTATWMFFAASSSNQATEPG